MLLFSYSPDCKLLDKFVLKLSHLEDKRIIIQVHISIGNNLALFNAALHIGLPGDQAERQSIDFFVTSARSIVPYTVNPPIPSRYSPAARSRLATVIVSDTIP